MVYFCLLAAAKLRKIDHEFVAGNRAHSFAKTARRDAPVEDSSAQALWATKSTRPSLIPMPKSKDRPEKPSAWRVEDIDPSPPSCQHATPRGRGFDQSVLPTQTGASAPDRRCSSRVGSATASRCASSSANRPAAVARGDLPGNAMPDDRPPMLTPTSKRLNLLENGEETRLPPLQFVRADVPTRAGISTK
ncbi:hypothetical protein T492DRAFT_912762 [Pavlovales sp. CCMP2436]|nr:hypothetical protein T492DRAFT_912762 [Pavlovales sp. CCMP2436]